jgi:hypothetical protein
MKLYAMSFSGSKVPIALRARTCPRKASPTVAGSAAGGV